MNPILMSLFLCSQVLCEFICLLSETYTEIRLFYYPAPQYLLFCLIMFVADLDPHIIAFRK